MSLLNQVLQDLEDRNASNSPKQKKINQVKAATASQKNSYFYLIILLCLTAGVALFNFYINKKSAPLVVPKSNKTLEILHKIPAQKPTTLPAINSSSANNQLKNEPLNIKPVIQEKTVPVESQVISTRQAEKLTTNNQQVKKTSVKVTKKHQTKRKKTDKQQKIQVTKKISSIKQAEKLFTQVKKETNKIILQSKLKQILKLNPKHVDARLLLANNLLTIGLLQETIETLDQGLQLFPQNIQFINFRSQLFLQNNQPQSALTILHQIDSRYSQDEMYLSLLAAAYQQNNDDLLSLKTYQKLLAINPQKAEYWLGLSIAQEKQGNKSEALKGYQQALDKKTLQKSIVSYIKQRISSLKRR